MIKKFTILFFLFLGGLGTAATIRAETVVFQASVDREVISLDDQLVYTLTVSGATDAAPEPVQIEGFQLVGSSVSTEFQIGGGRSTTTRSIRYIFIPLRAGEFRIPAAVLRHEGKTYATKTIEVRVTDRGVAKAERGKEKPQLFIEATLDKNEAFVNEQITLRVKILSHQLRLDDLNYSPPPTSGFIGESLGRERRYQETREGIVFDVIEIKTAIFPISPGELTIAAADLQGTVPAPRTRAPRSLFDDFFGIGNAREPFHLRSQPLKLQVKPWPRENRPAGFEGSVGRFNLAVGARPPELPVGEAITLTMRIQGEGNLDFVRPPRVEASSDFRVYPPEEESKRAVTADRIGGEKIFKQILIPQQAGELTIPEIRFSYLEPGSGAYRTLSQTPIQITAQPVETKPLRLVEALAPAAIRSGVAVQDEDILYIKEDGARWRRRTPRPFPARAWPYLLPWLVIPALWKARNHRERLRSDHSYARRLAAPRVVRKRFKSARRWARAGDRENFYGEIHRALLRYLSDKSGLPPGAVNAGTIELRLPAQGVENGLGAEIEQILQINEHARYAPGSAAGDEMTDLLERVERLVGRLEKTKWRGSE